MKILMRTLGVLVALLVLVGGIAFFLMQRKAAQPAPITIARTTLPLTFSDQVEIATAACGSAVTVDGKKTIACSTCPPNADFAGANAMPGAPSGWTYDGALPGHFTAANADEALLHATGCESHARNYGGDFLMQRSAGKWSILRYAPGGTANDKCQKLSWQQGRDAVICQSSDMHQGITSDAVQFLLFDAAAPAGEDWKDTLFLATTDDSSNCGFTQNRTTLQSGKIDAIQILPPDATGKQDVTVSATIARFPAPPEGTETCPATTPRTYRITFKNMGDHFEAADGYNDLATLAKDDCCELTLTEKVRPGKY